MKDLAPAFIEETILQTSLMVLHDCTSEQALKYLQSKGVDTGDTRYTTGHGWYYDVRPDKNEKGHEFRVMWFGKNDPALVAHEASHLVMSTFDDAGIPISNHNGETFAYHLGWWVKQIMNALAEKKPLAHPNTTGDK